MQIKAPHEMRVFKWMSSNRCQDMGAGEQSDAEFRSVVRRTKMEIIVILILVGCIAWIVWAVWRDKQELEKESLDRAWLKVLNDPHYMERLRREERKRAENARFDADNR
jgi:hypothetical protein